MRHRRRVGGGRDKEQVDGLLQHYALLDMNEGAVGGEGRVESGERIALRVEVAAEMRLERCGIGFKLVREAVDHYDLAAV